MEYEVRELNRHGNSSSIVRWPWRYLISFCRSATSAVLASSCFAG